MADNQRENIVRAAAEKMHVAGIRSVSIEDICHELGISKKTFYVYFETKNQLVDALLRHREEEMVADLERKTRNQAILDLVIKSQQMFRGLNDVRQIPPLLYDLQKYYPQQLKQHFNRLKMINRDIVARYLQQGIEEGFFMADLDVARVARVAAGLHQVMIDKVASAQGNSTILQDSKLAIDIFFRGLVSEEGKRQLLERTKGDKKE